MKPSSFLTIGVVLVLFIVIQGWILQRTFVAPRVFTATEAVIVGDTMEVRAPFQGMLRTVAARDGQRVQEDQSLFVVSRIVTNPETLEWRYEDLPILAVRSGIISGVQAKTGQFVQADQKLAIIVDNSSETMRVQAKLSIPAADVPRVQRLMRAVVKAKFLNNGSPIDAIVSDVDPVYDARSETLSVRLQLLRFPQGIEALPLGLPVEASVWQERAADDNPVMAFVSWFFPHSEAQAD